MKKIFLDTDIGGDIDDALALYFILGAPEAFELKGISTVHVEPGLRAGLARHICGLFKRSEIPVCAGMAKPLNGWWDKKHRPTQCDALDGSAAFDRGSGVDLMIDTAKKNPGMDIVAIGPLTNVAAALIQRPEIAKEHAITIMGGMVSSSKPEWNIMLDPEAARVVFESGAKLTMFGLDVTLKCRMNRAQADGIKKRGTERHDFLKKIMDIHENECRQLPVLHDPLALSFYMFGSEMGFSRMRLTVETRGEFTRGTTAVMDGWSPNFVPEDFPHVNVCVSADGDSFAERITEVIAR
ncbi:MAG: nucleoside hydrolase [Defluviitaleaceae bacterium]|nr:nucleoside hydrolase [Defluviitaleaceae bacterium]